MPRPRQCAGGLSPNIGLNDTNAAISLHAFLSPSWSRKPKALRTLAFIVALSILAQPLGAQVLAQAPAFVPRDESPEEFPAGPGRDEAFYACTACHNFKLVAAQGLSRERWDDSINWMTQKHNMPPLEGAERKVVLDYLAATFPPRAPSRAGGWQSPFAPK